jgi:hypothetical protein
VREQKFPPTKEMVRSDTMVGVVGAGVPSVRFTDYCAEATETGGAKFVPPEERIATFDQDGTLWVQHPIYSVGQREAGI